MAVKHGVMVPGAEAVIPPVNQYDSCCKNRLILGLPVIPRFYSESTDLQNSEQGHYSFGGVPEGRDESKSGETTMAGGLSGPAIEPIEVIELADK